MILVTGATGNVGRHLVSELQHRGLPARAFVRDEKKAAEVLPSDVELEVGDFADASSVTKALDGVKQVYLASNGPGQREYEGRVVEAAKKAGVRRIVKLSSWVDWGTSLWDWNADCEREVRGSSIPAVVLRPTILMANLLASRDSIREQGKLFAPAEGARAAFVDPRDVAAVAATILQEGGPEEQTYVLTGPEAITYEDIAQSLTTLLGRPIEFVPVSDEAAHQAFLGAGLPGWAADGLISGLPEVARRRPGRDERCRSATDWKGTTHHRGVPERPRSGLPGWGACARRTLIDLRRKATASGSATEQRRTETEHQEGTHEMLAANAHWMADTSTREEIK